MLEITIIGNQDCPEYEAAQQLAAILQNGTAHYEKGKIIIAVGMNCFGQKVKDIDLVVLGQFEQGFKRNINSKARNGKTEEEYKMRSVYFNNFCFCIEVKDHPPQSVLFQADQAYVRYKNRDFHNATNQSEDQKYALKGFLAERLKLEKTPWICNFIWFRNLEGQERITSSHNYLWSKFSLADLLQLACKQLYPSYYKGYYSFSAFNRHDSLLKDFNQVYLFFSSVKTDIGQLTRNRLERITKKLLKDQQYAQAIGNKLVVIRGRAGTGKTIKLLHVAYELCQRGHRCLILTYNKALVSDIKRLVALAGITDDIATATIEVKTIHSFMYDILIGFGVLNRSLTEATEKYKRQLVEELHIQEEELLKEIAYFKEQFFLKEYESLKDELIEYLQQQVINEMDIKELMKKEREKIDWDFIFIDESQDWPENEKEILFNIFKSHQFVIADGIDQLVRKISRSKWTLNVDSHIETKGQRRSLRQKANLCTFIRAYSDNFGLNWDVEPSDDLPGGRIIITTRPYRQEFHLELFENCEKDGNKPYEMMFLVPPNMVDKREKEYYRNGIKFKKPVNRFSLTETWKSWGIQIWDGTASDLRSVYPSDVREHRVLQYDSSRGLEGWIVVCLEMDEFFDYKLKVFKDEEEQQSLALFGDDEKALKWAHQWIMIPATRAIDTLVIQLGRRNSEFTRLLREVTKPFDFVEWID